MKKNKIKNCPDNLNNYTTLGDLMLMRGNYKKGVVWWKGKVSLIGGGEQ